MGWGGPNNGCNCGPCGQLDKEEEKKAEISHKPKPLGPVIDSWTWGQQPGRGGGRGPNIGFNCGPCGQMDKEEEERKAEISHMHKSSGPVIDSWTWGQHPGM